MNTQEFLSNLITGSALVVAIIALSSGVIYFGIAGLKLMDLRVKKRQTMERMMKGMKNDV